MGIAMKCAKSSFMSMLALIMEYYMVGVAGLSGLDSFLDAFYFLKIFKKIHCYLHGFKL